MTNTARTSSLRWLGILAIGIASASVQAAPVIYSQAYDNTANNLASQNDPTAGGSGNFARAYDNFQFASNQRITDVHWTGGFFAPPNETAITSWSIQFFNDAAGTPGSLALNASFTPALANQTFLAVVGAVREYTYSVDLTTPFNALAGTTYWLSVQPTMVFPPQWGWATAGPGTSVQDFFGVRTPYNFNLAFDLTGEPAGGVVPEPATLALLGMGLAGLAFSRRRKQG